MSFYRQQVSEAVGAVEILGPLRYAWLGVRNRALPPVVQRELDARAKRDHLRTFVAQQLYWSFYCRGGVVRARWLTPEAVSADTRLALAVASANNGSGRCGSGWAVERVRDGQAVVAANGLRARVPLDLCRAEADVPEPGTIVSFPAESRAISPGYLTMVGDAGYETGALVRVYWHVTYGGVATLVRALTARLNAEQMPFRLKVADHPSRFDRCDAAVLYVGHNVFSSVRPWLSSLALESASMLRPRVPAFTLPLAAGVGLAEDAGGQSFGERRCALTADGILEAHDRGATSAAARVEAVIARFDRAGIEIDAPYLEPSLAGRHVL